MQQLTHSIAAAFHNAPKLLAWRPFLEPLAIDRYWLWLLIPMALAIAIVYKTLKTDDLRLLPRKVLSLSVQIIFFMALAAGVLWFITEWA